jgi:hypothetical protein
MMSYNESDSRNLICATFISEEDTQGTSIPVTNYVQFVSSDDKRTVQERQPVLHISVRYKFHYSWW